MTLLQEINRQINILKERSSFSAELAEGQLRLLKNTNASRKDYEDFLDDLKIATM